MAMTDVLERPDGSTTRGWDGVPQQPGPQGAAGRAWSSLTIVAALTAFCLSLIAIVTAATATSDGSAGVGPSTVPLEVSLTLGDLFVKPSVVEVDAGRPITLMVRNTGALPHDLQVGGTAGVGLLAPGAMAMFDMPPITTDTTAWCTVPGHKAAGMSVLFKVKGAAGATAAGSAAAASPASAASSASAPSAAVIDGCRTTRR
jgi:nitrite reductase (NO-forming)